MNCRWKVGSMLMVLVLYLSFFAQFVAAKNLSLASEVTVVASNLDSSIGDEADNPEPCVLGKRYLVLGAYNQCGFPRFWRDTLAYNSPAAEISDAEQADLNVTHITQFPRYDYSDPIKNHHAPGDPVTFVAQVANRGNLETGPYDYQWLMDGIVVAEGSAASLASAASATFEHTWSWQDGSHQVGFKVDRDDTIEEISEQNNVVEDRIDALAVGFWVEQSVYDWFNQNQVNLGLGSVSWEDWAQRQLHYWNQMFEEAVSPLTPEGIVERVRLDQVVIIPDGTWEDCANWPSPEDQTVDLVWGFPSETVGVDAGRVCPQFNFYINNPQFQDFEPPLLHEMSHARYLIDLYGLNQFVNAAYLIDGVGSSSSSLIVDRNVDNDIWPLPVYLAVEGELIICQSKNNNSFTNCSRGAEGTTSRPHTVNTSVHLATVRLQDGHGNLVQGSSALPIVGDWDDHLYFNRYPDDLMSGGLGYGQHSAYAWNRIAGQRPICGNYNAPCNIGEYLNDVPENNLVEVLNLNDLPVAGLKVEVFQAKPFSLWYGRYFGDSADITVYTNAHGLANLGNFPFDNDRDDIIHTFGHSNALVLLKLSSNDHSEYRFLEVTQANEAFWAGHQETAIYRFSVPFDVTNPVNTIYFPSVLASVDHVTQPQAPQFVYPSDGQILDYGEHYLFKVEEIAGVDGFLWGFFQEGQLIWENLRDEGHLSSNEYGILIGTEAHERFNPGAVEVWVRASLNGEWTEPTIITIYLN